MALDVGDVASALGVAGGLLGAGWTAWHWILKRIEGGDARLEAKQDAAVSRLEAKQATEVSELHRRIDAQQSEAAAVRLDFVRRDDFHRDMSNLRTEVSGTREDVRRMGENITARLDRFAMRSKPDAE